MPTKISLFPTLNEDLIHKIRLGSTELKLSYEDNKEFFRLETEEVSEGSDLHTINDQRGLWTPEEYNLIIEKKYTFRTYDCLFGANGVACENAVIGIGLLWQSRDSKQRGIVPFGELRKDEGKKKFVFEYCFDAGQLRGLVEFSTILYLKESGTPYEGETHLANEEGIVLGHLDTYKLKIDGSGSIFPIFEVEEPKQPLWYVRCNWDDPAHDLFSENVAIYINRAHKNYRFLDGKNRFYDEQLLIEIVSTALVFIILKFKEDREAWDNIETGTSFDEGSVSEAVHYFITTFDWDVSCAENLSISIHKFFDRRT